MSLGLGLGSSVACSNVDRDPADECQTDVDCGTGSVCALEQGNVCVPEELPPQAAIGFDISEGDLRVELGGCDPEVSRELGGSRLRVQKRSGLVNNYNLRATTRRAVINCGGDECEGVCDEDALSCSEPTDATFELAMESRLGLLELRSLKKSYVITSDPPLPEGELPPPVAVTWPTYESTETNAHNALVLHVAPSAEATKRSTYRRVIAEDSGPEIDAVGTLRCQRGLFANPEEGVRTLSGSPVGDAEVEFVYAEDIALPSTVIGTAPSCDDDDACPAGWACNLESGSCGLNLNGVSAGSTTSTNEELGGYQPAWVYTYCEGIVATLDPILRTFTVKVKPAVDTGLPRVNYTLDQEFPDPFVEEFRQVEVQGRLCLPDWQPPQPISFSLAGEPVALAETELGVYACCSTECLPSIEPDVSPTPPPTVESCSSFTQVRFETRWYSPSLPEWEVDYPGCIPPAPDSDGSSGSYVRDVSECDEQGCSVALTPGGAEDLSRTYEVSIVQPTGSVFQSRRFEVEIDSETSEFAEPFELVPRVLLRGSINCATDSNCVATNAVVAAERLRVDTDDEELPGPFFFETRLDASGNFVLPLDPGVYVVTAYPAVGQPGAASRFSVIDLREGSSLIDLVDGIPNATLKDPLELDDGILVRVALEGFDVSTRVAPLDIGSWKTQDDFPADLYDLNNPQTCYGSQGCQIRRVRPTKAPISLLISKEFQFTARSRGGDKCE